MSEEPAGAWTIERLTRRHRREAFASGAPELDAYLRERALQDQRRLNGRGRPVRGGPVFVVHQVWPGCQ